MSREKFPLGCEGLGTVRCMSSASGVLSLDDVDLSVIVALATQVSFLGEKCRGLYKCDL